jgi:hypothetical protein
MTIPTSVKVGHLDYKIIVAVLPDNDYGNCDSHTQVITLTPNQTPQSAADTLLHEILHAIYNDSGLFSIKRPDEEITVRLIATWLKGVFRDNPEVTAFILDATKYWHHQAYSLGDKKSRR